METLHLIFELFVLGLRTVIANIPQNGNKQPKKIASHGEFGLPESITHSNEMNKWLSKIWPCRMLVITLLLQWIRYWRCRRGSENKQLPAPRRTPHSILIVLSASDSIMSLEAFGILFVSITSTRNVRVWVVCWAGCSGVCLRIGCGRRRSSHRRINETTHTT